MPPLEMLPVSQALELILAEIEPLPSEFVDLHDAEGRVLSADITADFALPPFASSSMDGYAVRAEDIAEASSQKPVRLQVLDDVAAGQVSSKVISEGQAARIMTGASMPAGSNTVVPVEHTNEPWRGAERPLPELIDIFRAVEEGGYVRLPGEDINPGDLILKSGKLLRPQEIGVLAALGISQVLVVRKPRVAVLATGSELIGIEDSLEPGKIRNSNGPTQAAQIKRMGAQAIQLGVARDTVSEVRSKLALGYEAGADLFVSSAGVSVGAHDVVKSVLEKDGLVKIWRVKMRPGKPLLYAAYKDRPYLGLPGNPVSAMVTFEKFARPVILKLAGHKKVLRTEIDITLGEDISSDGRESYIRAVVHRSGDGYQAVTTGSQGSHMMMSLVESNGLLIIPEGVKEVKAGEQLKAIMLDWPESVF